MRLKTSISMASLRSAFSRDHDSSRSPSHPHTYVSENLPPPLPQKPSQPPPISTPASTHTPVAPIYSAPLRRSVQDLDTDEDPPPYHPHDLHAQQFALCPPFIYTTTTSSSPRYQLDVLHTKTGKPYRLRIRRLLGSESRRVRLEWDELARSESTNSTSTSSSWSSNGNRSGSSRRCSSIPYDADLTLYETKNLAALSSTLAPLLSPGKMIEIRGQRKHTLPGTIHMELHSTLRHHRTCKFWHLTRNAAQDALRAENEARMLKYGYHAEEEWDRELLFCVTGAGKWKDGGGRDIGKEEGEQFAVTGACDDETRELLITCWTARKWACGGLDLGTECVA